MAVGRPWGLVDFLAIAVVLWLISSWHVGRELKKEEPVVPPASEPRSLTTTTTTISSTSVSVSISSLTTATTVPTTTSSSVATTSSTSTAKFLSPRQVSRRAQRASGEEIQARAIAGRQSARSLKREQKRALNWAALMSIR